jgi:phosphoadenosine phosphosulfate reductase
MGIQEYTAPSAEAVPDLNKKLAGKTPQEILAWAIEQFGDRVTLACSFGGVSGMALLDMAVKIKPALSVFYLDTDFLFPETYATRDAAIRKYGVIPLGVRSKLTPEEQAAQYGDRLWERDPDLCCAIRKVEPSGRALAGKDAWIAGLRRDQSTTRRTVEAVQWDAKAGLYKICPLYNWTEDDVWTYISREGVPVNELHAHGYPSIGCTYCTHAIAEGGGLRDGRWAGFSKIECGLHK